MWAKFCDHYPLIVSEEMSRSIMKKKIVKEYKFFNYTIRITKMKK